MRKVLQVGLALLLLVLGAGLAFHSWRAEGRNKFDTTFLQILSRDEQGRVAQWVQSLIPKLVELEARVQSSSPGTPEYAAASAELATARNLIAEKEPTLVSGYDEHGNALLQPLEIIQTQRQEAVSGAKSQNRTVASTRKISNINLKTMPEALKLSDSQAELLVNGWYEPPLGQGYRFTEKTATCYIKNNPAKTRIALQLMFPESLGTARGAVYVNNKKAGTFSVSSNTPVTLTYKKPSGSDKVLRVKLVNNVLSVPDKFIHNGDTQAKGVAVVRIKQE